MAKIKQNIFFIRQRKPYLFIRGVEISIFSLAVFLVGLGSLGYAAAEYYKPPQPKDLVGEKSTEKPLIIDKTPFSEWIASIQIINDLVKIGDTIKLSDEGYKRQQYDIWYGRSVRDPQGYIQSPIKISENVFICTKVWSLSSEVDYSLRLNNKFQIIHGDGDDRSMGLKQISPTNPNGDYLRPDASEGDPHVDRLNRWELDRPIPTGTANGKEFTSCLTIHAPPGKVSKEIIVELHILDSQGDEMDLGPMPTWTLVDNTQQNSTSNNFAVGLIDSRHAHPVLELRGYCAVEMNDLGDRPSPRERAACIHT